MEKSPKRILWGRKASPRQAERDEQGGFLAALPKSFLNAFGSADNHKASATSFHKTQHVHEAKQPMPPQIVGFDGSMRVGQSVKSIEMFEGHSLHFDCAQKKAVGGREHQEDFTLMVPDLNLYVPKKRNVDLSVRRSLFAVFDGHGGPLAAKVLSQNFHLHLVGAPFFGQDPKRALTEAFEAAEMHLGNTFRRLHYALLEKNWQAKFPKDGSTATVAFVEGDTIYVSNCGDSQAILLSDAGEICVLTESHNTSNADEYARVKAAGAELRGYPLRRGWFPKAVVADRVEVQSPPPKLRVYPGGLLVTRSFGDFNSKIENLGGVPGSIIADCGRIREVPISNDVHSLVICTDGVWDALTKEDVRDILFHEFSRNFDHPLACELAAGAVVEKAVRSPKWFEMQSPPDNASVVVVCLMSTS